MRLEREFRMPTIASAIFVGDTQAGQESQSRKPVCDSRIQMMSTAHARVDTSIDIKSPVADPNRRIWRSSTALYDRRSWTLQFYEAQYKQAWGHVNIVIHRKIMALTDPAQFMAKQYDRAFQICFQLLNHADLGDVFAAGCHVMLSRGDDCQVAHASKALELLACALDEPGNKKSQKQKNQKMIAVADK